LNDESRSDDVSRGDAIHLPPLQLLKKAAHIRSDSAGWTIVQNLDSSIASSDIVESPQDTIIDAVGA
jgi:hypothetical protein